jgi:hypothetical protein
MSNPMSARVIRIAVRARSAAKTSSNIDTAA